MPLISRYDWGNIDELQMSLSVWTVVLFGLVVLTAVGYCLWRSKGASKFHFKKLSFRQLGLAAAVSIAVPILAASLQTEWVVNRGIRFYTAMLWDLSNPGLWIFVGVEALITFLLLWLFMSVALWFRWPVFLLCLTFCIWIGFESIAGRRADSFSAPAFAKTASLAAQNALIAETTSKTHLTQ